MSIVVEIITPSGLVLSKCVDSLSVNTSSGEVHILPAHLSLITVLEVGCVKLFTTDGVEDVATSSGLLHFERDHAVILVGEAIDVMHDERIQSTIIDAERSAQDILSSIHRQGVLEQEELDRLSAHVRAQINKNLERTKNKQRF